MLNFRKAIIFLLSLFILTTGTQKTLHAGVSTAAVLFLKIVGSPKAVGMGACVANNIDEQAALYSTGAFGLLCLDKNLSISFPSITKWLPELTDDIQFKTFSISGGNSFSIFNNNLKLGVGGAYSTIKLDYGEIGRIDEVGNLLGTIDAYNKANCFTIGFGLEYYARIGFGVTYKSIKSYLAEMGSGTEFSSGTAKGSAIDYGIMIELPISNLIPLQIHSNRDSNNYINFEIIPSFAFVKANIGDDVAYIDVAQADPLPKLSRTGLAIYAAINTGDANLISARIATQIEKDLVGSSHDKIKSDGYEIGFLGFFNYRWGRVNDDPGDIHIRTEGFGISFMGIISWFDTSGSEIKNKTVKYLLDNLDITYSYAKYDDDSNEPLSNTKFLNISLSI